MKFKYSKNYPWSNKKERDLYYDKLLSEDTHLNRVRYEDLITREYEESKEIKNSYINIFLFLTLVFFLIAIKVYDIRTLSMVSLLISLGSLAGCLFLEWKIKRINNFLEIKKFATDMMFMFKTLIKK